MNTITSFVSGFWTGFFRTTPHKTAKRKERQIRDNLDEGQVDSMVDNTFPASDPPSTY
ncbi:MAG: hypothetical protein JF571_04165 [Asticcacaulis sp.]|nr:hypothetical protein [Asticcacaulis sp.]